MFCTKPITWGGTQSQISFGFSDRKACWPDADRCSPISARFLQSSCLKSCRPGRVVGSGNNLQWRVQVQGKGRVFCPKAVTDSWSPQPLLDPEVRKSVLAIILGGGAGTRLYPITKSRAKPAVPLGASYRLIDIPVSNCINSNILKIYVLTQYNSTSLNRHISLAYNGSIGGIKDEGFVEVLAAQQSPENPNWFQGTADAVRQYMWLFDEHPVKEYLILAGDHLYKMDYQKFVQTHRDSNADITIATVPVDENQAESLGILKIENGGRITEFVEKPKGKALEKLMVDTACLGINGQSAMHKPFIASMGIYVISKDVARKLLFERFPNANDFGHELIPGAISSGLKVQAHVFDGYWEDIGTIKAFYNANLALTKKPVPAFSLYDRSFPIYTHKRSLPPSMMRAAQISDSVIGEGCILKRCSIHHSVIGICSRIEDEAIIEDSLLLGANYYETNEERSAIIAAGGIPIGIGKNSHVKKAVIDKNARVGDNVKIINVDNVQEADREKDGYCIRAGIVIVIKGAVIPHDTVI